MKGCPVDTKGLVNLDEIKVWGANYNSGDVEGIARSIRRFGFNNVPRLWRDHEVRGGNHTVMALRKIKADGPDPKLDKHYPPENVTVDDNGAWWIGWVDISHLDALEADAFAIADNQFARNAVHDDAKLFEYLKNIAVDPTMLAATGFDDKTFDELRLITERLEGEAAQGSEGDTPEKSKAEMKLEELQAKWGVEPGDVWLIPSNEGPGTHRLVCGDCRDTETVKRLCVAPAQIAVTSPPYAEQRKDDYASIPPNEYVDWWESVQSNVKTHLVEGGSFFVNIKPHCEDGERVLYVHDLVSAMKRRWGWRFVDEFCWERVTAPGRWDNRFKNGFEPVYQFQKGKGGKFAPTRVGYLSEQVMVSAKETGGAKETGSTGSYYNIGSETQPGLALPPNIIKVTGVQPGIPHPALFPVGLPEFFIKVFTDPGDVIYEPFAGGGSTFVAGENTGRIVYGMELSPAYCAAILQRLHDHGLAPERMN